MMTLFSSDQEPLSAAMYRLVAFGPYIFAVFILPALGQLTGPASTVYVSGCPAVVSTANVCSTCMTIDCVVPATITAGCGSCATSPPTVYRTFPCEQGCSIIGCKTVYSVATASNSNACDGASAPLPPLPPPDVDTSSDDHVGTNSASAISASATQMSAANTSITNTPDGSPNQNAPATVTSTAGAARFLRPGLWW